MTVAASPPRVPLPGAASQQTCQAMPRWFRLVVGLIALVCHTARSSLTHYSRAAAEREQATHQTTPTDTLLVIKLLVNS